MKNTIHAKSENLKSVELGLFRNHIFIYFCQMSSDVMLNFDNKRIRNML